MLGRGGQSGRRGVVRERENDVEDAGRARRRLPIFLPSDSLEVHDIASASHFCFFELDGFLAMLLRITHWKYCFRKRNDDDAWNP